MLDIKKKYSTSEEFARHTRINVLNMCYKAKSSHLGGNFSEVDLLSVLYYDVLRYDPLSTNFINRDRFILSKGHCCAALYSILADCGFFPIEDLSSFGQNGSYLSCHVSANVPGVELSSGSLGHGLNVACGMAYHAKHKQLNHKIYVLVGDGECDEGSVWEAIMFAGQNKLNNLVMIVDTNRIQAMGFTKDILDIHPLTQTLQLFHWKTIEIDGHNHKQIREALLSSSDDMPTAIIANTIKGKGVSFMENELWWHYQVPFGEYYEKALKELEENK